MFIVTLIIVLYLLQHNMVCNHGGGPNNQPDARGLLRRCNYTYLYQRVCIRKIGGSMLLVSTGRWTFCPECHDA